MRLLTHAADKEGSEFSMDILGRHLGVVLELGTNRLGDHRGFFSETFNAKKASSLGMANAFVQDNQSLSHTAGTVRGLHFQNGPHAQGKLVRVLKGRTTDVALDIRPDSDTFGQHCAVELSAEEGNQLWIPAGFAHGFCTLEPDTEVFYKVTGYWNQAAERSIRWNDPALAIDWRITGEAFLSDKDRDAPLFAQWLADSSSEADSVTESGS